MKPNATLWERFDGWFLKPVEKLKECPDGDGAFLAMSTALFLCERYYRTITNTHEGIKDDLSFKIEAAKDLGVAQFEFDIFWTVFRHGVQHQGMPKIYKDRTSGIQYRWNIGFAYDALPLFLPTEPSLQVIVFNPWAFMDLISQKYRDNPDVLGKATVHVFGEAN